MIKTNGAIIGRRKEEEEEEGTLLHLPQHVARWDSAEKIWLLFFRYNISFLSRFYS